MSTDRRRNANGRRPASRTGNDGRNRRGGFKRFLSKAWKSLLVAGALCFVAGVAALAIAYTLTPDLDDLDPQGEAAFSATSITYADGSEAATTGKINRIKVSRDKIPDTVVNGVLGAEQRDFYEQPGISINGTLRAVLSGGQAGGGSGITQQMARNYYDGLSQERSYIRKVKEILISLKVSRQMSPDDILTQYLNTIYFGRNAYGVQAAAQAYFGKDVEDLDAAEGAFIGALIQQPGNFSNPPAGSKMEKVLQSRWQYAVNGEVDMHDDNPSRGLSQSEADALKFPKTIPWDEDGQAATADPTRGYIRRAVVDELKDRYGLTDQQIATKGYKVTTSLDKDLIDAAGSAFKETLPNIPDRTNLGLAAVEPKTGEIKAFHGGDDPVNDPDNSLYQRAQAGSAFKPYVLATALEQGIGLKSTFDGNSPKDFPGLSAPVRNDSNRSWGTVDLVKATAKSVNTAYVQLAIDTTPQSVVETAKAAGIAKDQFDTAELGPNIALGTYQVTALDQAAGYATFANGGVHVPQHMVTEVTDPASGEKLEPNDQSELDSGKRAFSADVAADATYAMRQVVENGGGSKAALPDGRPVAGKTGTSNDAKSAWFVGYTPQLAVSVGLSRTDGQQLVIPSVSDVYGGTTSARIWRAFMAKAMEGEPVKNFPAPAWTGTTQHNQPTATPTPEPSPTPSTRPDPTPTPSTEPDPSPDPLPSPDPDQDCPPTDPLCFIGGRGPRRPRRSGQTRGRRRRHPGRWRRQRWRHLRWRRWNRWRWRHPRRAVATQGELGRSRPHRPN
uniref:transglycosylase domain-containing protein n=1 Tax=Nocardiopsis gilva TaxID=280236 RepID=UPI001F4D07FB|nr:transglycosylase domain-containing protein [Nocardiopsis gilva]